MLRLLSIAPFENTGFVCLRILLLSNTVRRSISRRRLNFWRLRFRGYCRTRMAFFLLDGPSVRDRIPELKPQPVCDQFQVRVSIRTGLRQPTKELTSLAVRNQFQCFHDQTSQGFAARTSGKNRFHRVWLIQLNQTLECSLFDS